MPSPRSARPDVGAAAEYRFASECLKRGIIPLWPSTESRPYDLVIDTGNKRLRVQVKGTEMHGDRVEVMFSLRVKTKTRIYTKQDVDFIVVYLFRYDAWYIFPVGSVRASALFKPNDYNCKYRKYRDAWYLLAAAPKR